jgi:4-cresol dehydrogenase (hydroxylating)
VQAKGLRYMEDRAMTPFVEELGREIGAEKVRTDDAVRAAFSRTTAPDGTRPLGVATPASREDVQAIVRAAARHRIALFPISRGKNWGYGDACAPQPDNLIVDLSGMNRIIEVNAELAYAVIEPGVTQGELVSHLERERLPLILDTTGAGPDASIVGNVLERGSGHTPYGDHFATSCNYEIVLPDGSIIQTGFGSYPNARAQNVYKYGIGPTLDGLFTQSNLGIVTRMTVWLMAAPENFAMFIVALREKASLGPFMEAVRRLRLAGSIRSTMHCFNRGRLLAGATRFPWDKADGRQALEVAHPDVYQAMCEQFGLPEWGATGSIHGSAAEVRATGKTIRAALKSVPGLERIVVLGERAFATSQTLARWLRPVAGSSLLLKRLDSIRLGRDMLQGRPSWETLKGSHWRARTAPASSQTDPNETGSGLAWIAPILPLTASAMSEVSELAETAFHRYGFEYQATFTAFSERAAIAVLSISFDNASGDERDRARNCQGELLDGLLARGYVPYRGPVSVMRPIWKVAPEYWRGVGSIKACMDPGGVIAPGRYIPEATAGVQT